MARSTKERCTPDLQEKNKKLSMFMRHISFHGFRGAKVVISWIGEDRYWLGGHRADRAVRHDGGALLSNNPKRLRQGSLGCVGVYGAGHGDRLECSLVYHTTENTSHNGSDPIYLDGRKEREKPGKEEEESQKCSVKPPFRKMVLSFQKPIMYRFTPFLQISDRPPKTIDHN